MSGRTKPRAGSAWALALAACLALAAPALRAADLQVSPISLEFKQAEQAQALWLSNTGSQPVRAQLRVYAWSQDGGTEKLEPSGELVASPPAVVIAAGSRQLVRLVRPQAAAVTAEKSFRVVIDELPALAPGGSRPGLAFLLRYSVPVFVSTVDDPVPPAKPQRALSGRVTQEDGKTWLTLSNAGQRRVRLSHLVLDNGGTRVTLVDGLLGYVLAGRTMRWEISARLPQLVSGRLSARLDSDAQEQPLPLEPLAP
ncbi:fimbrial biogenesis chaperone [Ramlibacter humi]|uniref:Molecular chaperone n=1 Tax=Ramlibacter humi TaxID=2530451 RepID=A0A4Z0BDZ8_9BURK|nr:fimbria/pilus periplasmic chaperone [Ramlibacter humi]TFY97030.1 molecular chaperone [Ramlibacter humi]